MLTEDNDEFVDLLTRPMSESEISQFKDVLASADMKVMMRAYHSEAALNGARGFVLELFQDKNVPPTVMLQALMQICLENIQQLGPEIRTDLTQVWLNLPAVFCESWTQLVLDAMQSQRENLKTNAVPELEEMYARWKAAIPSPQDLRQAHVRDLDLTRQVYQVFYQFQEQLKIQPDIALEEVDYLDIWMHLILQVYIFTYLDGAELYYLFASNAELVSAQILTFVYLLQAVEGYEDLLLPENKKQLMALLQPSN